MSSSASSSLQRFAAVSCAAPPAPSRGGYRLLRPLRRGFLLRPLRRPPARAGGAFWGGPGGGSPPGRAQEG
eukprot:11476629-Alexandrium_andersonii.AAC.1